MGQATTNSENLGKSQSDRGYSQEVGQRSRRKRISYLATGSILSAILGIFFFALDILSAITTTPGSFSEGGPFFAWRIFMLLFFAVAVMLGVLALFTIHFRDKGLKGSKYAVAGIILGSVLGSLLFTTLCMSYQVRKVRDEHLRAKAGEAHLRQLGRAIIDYTKDHDGSLPPANQWSDLLLEHNKSLSKDTFKNPNRPNGICNFTFNKNLDGLSLSDVPGNTILLFEADGDWNLNGAAELLETKQRKKEIVVLVLFADEAIGEYWFPDVRFLRYNSDKLSYSPLRWKP